MRRGIRWSWGAAIAGSLAAAAASATTVERLTLGDLTERAPRIVEARVVATAPARDLRGRPATRVTLHRLASLKGDAPAAFDVLLPGGTLDGETLAIAGIPRFREGEEVLLFLSAPSTAGLVLPIGLGQGTWRASVDPATGERRLAPDLLGIELVDPATGAPAAPVLGPIARDALLGEVRRRVAAK